MQDIRLTWTQMKAKVTDMVPFSYIDRNGNYYIMIDIGGYTFMCVLRKGGSDATEFEETYMETSVSLT